MRNGYYEKYYNDNKARLNYERTVLYNIHKYGIEPEQYEAFKRQRRFYIKMIQRIDDLDIDVILKLFENFSEN